MENSSMNNILLSVVVPIKNIDFWIDNILNNISLCSTKCNDNDVEFIFVHSTERDESVENLKGRLDRVFSEYKNISFVPQRSINPGIYGAMNTGLEYSKGVFLLFLGADDKLISSAMIDFLHLLRLSCHHDIVLAEASLSTGITKAKFSGGRAGRLSWLFGMPRCHQAIAYRKNFLKKYNITYSTRIKVSSDYIFTSEVFSYNPSILTTDLVIVVYDVSGYSSKFSSFYLYLEHIKGFRMNNRLHKFFVIVLLSRGALILFFFMKRILGYLGKRLSCLGSAEILAK